MCVLLNAVVHYIFVGDIGDLMKLIQAQNKIRFIPNYQEKLKHDLADCLWSIIILANLYDVNLETAFIETMRELELRLYSTGINFMKVIKRRN